VRLWRNVQVVVPEGFAECFPQLQNPGIIRGEGVGECGIPADGRPGPGGGMATGLSSYSASSSGRIMTTTSSISESFFNVKWSLEPPDRNMVPLNRCVMFTCNSSGRM